MYNTKLADRVSRSLEKKTGFDAVQMFGGLAFMVKRHMCCGVLGNDLILRLDKQSAAALIRQKHIQYFNFTGTPMRSIVTIKPKALEVSGSINKYVNMAFEYVQTLPPKKPKKKKKMSKTLLFR